MEENSGEKYAESILKKSPLYLLYNKFNRKDIDDKDIHYCINKIQFRKKGELYNLCKMFEKNLSELPTIMKEEDSKEHCRYLTFWINDKIRNNFKTHNVHEEYHNYIIQGFLSVSYLVNQYLSKIQCKYDYNKMITMEIWKEWKDLYDYIRIKHNLQGIINSNKELCEIYPKYHNYIEGIYNKYKEECCRKENGNCPNELNFKEWCEKGDVLTELTCTHSHNDAESPVQFHELASKEEESDEKQKAEDETEGNAEKKEEQSQIQGLGREALSVGKGGDQFLTEPIVTERRLNPEVTETLRYTQLGMEYNNGEPSSDNTSNPARTIIYTSLGLVLPLATLYRFTPLGSWVSTKILGRNKLMENMKKNNYELLLNDVGNHEESVNHPTYHIRYNSATNH